MRTFLPVKMVAPTRWARLAALLILVAALVALASLAVVRLAGGQAGKASANSNASAPAQPAQQAASSGHITQTLTITPKKPQVGDEVQAVAQNLPPNAGVHLVWKTQKGDWVIEDYYHFKGKKLTGASLSLGKAQVGTDGHLNTRFTIPEDYGGMHDVQVVGEDGTVLAQGGIEVTQSFEMSPREGPVGTVIEVKVKGFGWRTMESTWVVNWDNSEVGYLTAVSTSGSATARFRATGAVGPHAVKLYTGYMGQSYLNFEQAPNAYLPRPDLTFNVTPGAAAQLTYAEPYPVVAVPSSESATGAHLSISPVQGPVQTKATLRAEGLPANATLSLFWETWAGSRVSGQGFDQQENALGEVKTDGAGRLELPVTIPDDLGGIHNFVLKNGDKVLAQTSFRIETSIVSISPASGPAGTKVTIHLKGVGWTEYDNIFVATYDNAYMGYVCGFNSQGDVVMNFTAAGQPGIHLIDLYPGIYQGPAEGQQLYRLPQLTYADDHPGNKIPALRFGFEITK